MKQIFTTLAIAITLGLGAQETPFYSEDFEGDLPGWLLDDLDGDTNNWSLAISSDQAEAQGWGPDGTFMAASFAYNLLPGEEAPLNPDNLLISPPIEIPTGGVTSLHFLLGTNVEYMNEHNFALYIVNEYSTFDDGWIPFYEKNFAGIDTAQDIALDISDFNGETIQLVFRHYDSEAQFVLLLDDIAITKETLAVNDVNNGLKLSVYPNPVQNFVQISVEGGVEKTEIYNLNGQKVLVSSQDKIDVRGLAKGVYILRIKTATESYTKKIIKQ